MYPLPKLTQLSLISNRLKRESNGGGKRLPATGKIILPNPNDATIGSRIVGVNQRIFVDLRIMENRPKVIQVTISS
jgi:hypothetical protein